MRLLVREQFHHDGDLKPIGDIISDPEASRIRDEEPEKFRRCTPLADAPPEIRPIDSLSP